MKRQFLQAIRDDRSILYFVCALVFVFATLLLLNGVSPFRPSSYLSNILLYSSAWVLIEGVIFLRALFAEMPHSPFAFARSFLIDRRDLYIAGIPLVVAAVVFMPLFSAMKSSIPIFTAYTWDGVFIDLDRLIFGEHAWEALHPILGFPIITSFLSFVYHLWFLLIYGGTVYFAVYRREERKTYFLSFYAIWALIGVFLAISLASVGPAFLEPLLNRADFVAQIAYLERANEQFPVLTIRVQQILLDWHFLGQHGIGRGITAMPSMHVALATIFWLSMRRVSRATGWFFLVFLLLIFLGSVHLAYHYAVDGIVSFFLGAAIWYASDWFVNTSERQAAGNAPEPAADVNIQRSL